MNICILSMQRVNNYGSLLQSYSLKKILEQMGYSVSFIDIEQNPEENKYMKGYRQYYINENENECKNKLISKLYKVDKYILNRIRHKIILKKQTFIFDKFRAEKLEIKANDNAMQYDVCIIGSDEVFNCTIDSKWGFTSQLFGNVKQTKSVITYAASCGSTTYKMLPQNVKEIIISYISRIKMFSVRDSNTYDFIKKLNGVSAEIHLDPVIVGDFTNEIDMVDKPIGLPNKYCVIYSYDNRFNKKKEIYAIKKFCKSQGMEIITLGSPQMWITKHYALSPFELLKAFQMAEYVITDTFHGAIFSAKYAKKYSIIIRESNKNKLKDLVERLNIESHLLFDINDIMNQRCDSDDAKQIILMKCREERKRTINYLSRINNLQYR